MFAHSLPLANALSLSANPLNRHLIAKFLFYGLDRGRLNTLDTVRLSSFPVGDQEGLLVNRNLNLRITGVWVGPPLVHPLPFYPHVS